MGMNADLGYRDLELQFLEELRPQYETKGYRFRINPGRDELPSFLGSYEPDAIAISQDKKIAIEVKTRPHTGDGYSIKQIRDLFEGHADWQFVVAYSGGRSLERLSVSDKDSIVSKIEEVKGLVANGHNQAAFLVAWSLLEAALNVVKSDSDSRPRTAGTVIQTLVMEGFVSYESEALLRPLIERRNRLAHGDLSVEPTRSDVDAVLKAVSETLEGV